MTTPTKDLVDPWEMHRELTAALVQLTVDYLNVHAGRMSDPARFSFDSRRLVNLRDSVLYRFESLAYHVDLIRHRESQCIDEFRTDLFLRDGIEIVRWASRDMKFLLDDIVFSTMSLFDYFGNLTGFVLLDERKRNINWRGVLTLRDSGPRTFLRSGELHDEWIGGVAMYRHSLIHASSDTGGGSKQLQIEGGQATLEIRITAPPALIENIKYLRETVPEEGLRVIDAALWVVGQTFDSIVELCACLTTDR